nr:hypothetical protein GCM10017611_61330 [Rhodococcus wratislaviensis]
MFNAGALEVVDLDAVRVGPAPAAGVLDATITAEKRRGADIVGITLAMTLALDGSAAATMSMTIQWMPGDAWDRRQKGRAPLQLDPARPHPLHERVEPREVARHSFDNVVLSRIGSTATPCAARCWSIRPTRACSITRSTTYRAH